MAAKAELGLLLPDAFLTDGNDYSGDAAYDILEEISRGAYGVVYRARDERSGEIVAIKEEINGLCPSTAAEISILRSLPPHPCVVGFKQAAGGGGGGGVYVVMEHMKTDLARWRHARRQPYALHEIKYLMEEILKGVAHLHRSGIMHRDLKPANILLGRQSEVKICDFGLAARLPTASGAVGTLWYTAPEVLIGGRDYTCAVDIWGVGATMAEFLLDRVLFRGESECDQIHRIQWTINPHFSFLRREMAAAAREAPGKAVAALTAAGFDLLERLLAYEPEYRITAEEALHHAWFSEVGIY